MKEELQFEGLAALIIEDEVFMRNLLQRILHEIGFSTIHTAEDGAAAIQLLEGANAHVDVIICDLDMPLVDGFDFLRMLRQSQKVRDSEVPVIVVTGNSEGRNVNQAVGLGIHGFVVKPVSKKTLMNRLSHALKREKVSFKGK